MFDIKEVKDEAEKEIRAERMAEAKKRIKSHLRAIADAELVVANLERELEDLYDEVSQRG